MAHINRSRLRPGCKHADANPSGCYSPDNVAPQDNDEETEEVDTEDYAEPRPGVFIIVRGAASRVVGETESYTV